MRRLKPEPLNSQNKILVVLDNPLKVENDKGVAFSAPSLARGMTIPMERAGISRSEVSMTYLVDFLPPDGALASSFYTKGDDIVNFHAIEGMPELYIKNYLLAGFKRLLLEIELTKPNIVVVAGKYSLLLLTGVVNLLATKRSQFGTLLTWRGSHLPLRDGLCSISPTLIPVLPPYSLSRMPAYRQYAESDYMRIAYLKDNPRGTPLQNPYSVKVCTDFKEARDILGQLELALGLVTTPIKLSVDIETERGYMDSIALTWEDSTALVIPWCGEDYHVWEYHEEVELVSTLSRIFLHTNVHLVGQNFAYDMQYIYRFWGIKIYPKYDTMLMHHVWSPAMKKGLANLSSLYCVYHKYWKDEGKIKLGASRAERWEYNGKDTIITYELAKSLEFMLSTRVGATEVSRFQIEELVPVTVELMYGGLRVDLALRTEYTKQVRETLLEIDKIFAYIGLGDINLQSPQQLKTLFYDLLQAPKQIDSKTGNLSTNREALRAIKESSLLTAPIVELLELRRSLSVVLNTFLLAKLDIDNRLRCFYQVAGTNTYRFASKKNAFDTGLNLQNIPPAKTMFGVKVPSIQNLIIPDEGYTYFDADLGSADARIVMAECGSKIMREIFDSGNDLYATLAGEFYNRPILYKENKEDKAIRKMFKMVAHATHYLGSPAGIASRTGLPIEDVKRMQKWYFSVNPELLEYHENIKASVQFNGYIENVFGYRYTFIDRARLTIYQEAAAWKPQSTIGILINKVMVKVHKELRSEGVQVQLQVHDSIAGQYPTHKPELRDKILDCFNIPLEYPSGQLIIPSDMVTSTKSWGHCKA